MTQEILEKCLRFAAGDKDYQVAYNIKKPGFPDSLLVWSKEEKAVVRGREEGLPFDEIRERLGKSRGARQSLYYALDTVQRKEELYYAWTEFWKEIEPIRDITLAKLCEEEQENQKLQDWILKFKDSGVVTVGDFLMECVTMPMTSMSKKFDSTNATIKPIKLAIIDKIRVMVTHGEEIN